MRKIFTNFLILTLLLGLTACESSPTADSGQPSSGPAVTVSEGNAAGADSGGNGSYKDLRLGGAGKKDGVYTGLQYVKTMPYLPTAVGEEAVSNDNEVLLAFFEFCNDTDSTKNVNLSKVTCYADGEQVSGVETNWKVVADGVKQYYSVDLDAGCQLLCVLDFEVRKGWSEVKFFYSSDCVWTLTQEDVSANDYSRVSLFSVDNDRPITDQGEVIYSEDYEVRFDGVELYHKENAFSDDNDYLVFKYCITNNSESTLDTMLMGYKMRAYQNNSYLGDASYSLTDKIDKYINIYGIDSIEPGMSGNVYVAFHALGNSGSAYMVYDDGYIKSHFCGTACAEIG